jgi:hypothetical protein
MDGRVFLYRGFAVGVGGTLTRPFQQVLDGQAAATLPIVGGYTSSRVENFRFREVVSFREAHTYTTGNQSKDGTFNTLVCSTILGLNILDIVTCDALVARVSSRHGPEDPEPQIDTSGSAFHNLKVGGRPVQVDLDIPLFSQLSTYSAFRKKFEEDRDFQNQMTERFLWQAPPNKFPPAIASSMPLPNRKGWPESRGVVPCSLVKDLSFDAPELTRYAHVLSVPQVGNIFLGEFFVSQYARRLVMMRLELGSPFEGRLLAADVETDGTTYP